MITIFISKVLQSLIFTTNKKLLTRTSCEANKNYKVSFQLNKEYIATNQKIYFLESFECSRSSRFIIYLSLVSQRSR